MPSSPSSDEQNPGAEQPEEPDATKTGTDGDTSDEDKAYRDYTTFWETRPSREMIKQLSTQEIDSHKTDLNVATLEVWKLKALTFMRRRHHLINALGKPIVAKLVEKLKKCRAEKGKTVSSIEACDECETELECSVLESIDLAMRAAMSMPDDVEEQCLS